IVDINDLETDKHFGFVQFHPSYDYTDFVEGLRPKNGDNGNIGFERKNGVFKEFCKNAIGLNTSNDFTLDSLQNVGNDFETIYQSIVNDIKTGKITQYNTAYKTQKVGVKNNRIVYRVDSTSPRTESERNVKLLYDYFVNHNIYDLSDYGKNEYWELISKLTNGRTVTIDYMEYSWILQELLKRTTVYQNSVEKRLHDYMHPDIIMSDDTKSIIEKSRTTPKSHNKFVFIIDEINRGEVSKIFGELFFSIDPGYRGEVGKVNTQYQNMIEEGDVFYNGFFVPENVYIIGTMNDIDRSVESMDFAMRRRFAWKEVTAEESMQMLDGMSNEQALKNRMRNLNNAILKIQGLGKAYQIGAAYFKKIENYDGDFEKLWEYHLEGLLAEYLRGNQNADKQLEELKKAYDNETAKHEATDTDNGQS
ncbi:MAG: AAA family ATPase, partial [Prevotella sp.]|nr:AAA family ATPase [Prevotella sp.]